MTDCPNVEMREQLPDYLNGTLPASERAELEAHLRGCADCAAELETIRLVREVFQPAPQVDVARIVAALPSHQAVRTQRSWVRRHAFQVAAAVSFIALGGMSLTVARSFFMGDAVTGDSVAVVADAGYDVPLISFAGGVSDLEEEDLESLLQALESIEALPAAEPAAAALIVDRPGSS
jgi:anti-sigma factor RsiW